MRVALNVAALACRGSGSGSLVSGYNAMLQKRQGLLADAQAAALIEYGGRGGQAEYDSAMTKLYNYYAQPLAQGQFCEAARRVQQAEGDVDETSFRNFTSAALVDLNAPFAAHRDEARLASAYVAYQTAAPAAAPRTHTVPTSKRRKRK